MPRDPIGGERRANIADFRLSVDGSDLRGDLAIDRPLAALAAATGLFRDITDQVRPRLISLTLTEKRGGEADELELVLDDADGKLAIPPAKAVITVQLGWRQGRDVAIGLIDKGRFVADEPSWSGPPDQVTIRARSADLTAGFRVRRESAHRATTLGQLARDVAARNGLEPRIAPELAAIPVAILTQHQQSDMALLRRLGREHDAVATIKAGRLILSPIGRGTTATGRALPALVLTRRAGDRWNYTAVDRSADAGVEARWHDQDAGERRTVKVGGKGGDARPRRLRKVYASEHEATAAAKAEAGRTARAAAEFGMTLALGRPELVPETPVTLDGFKPPIDARRWILAEASHRLEAGGGLATTVKLETAG